MDNLVPAPVRVGGNDQGTGFLPDHSTTLLAGAGTGTTERWLRSALGASLGLPLAPARPGDEATGNTVELRVDPALAPEAYQLTVAPGTGVRITGGDPAGVFWGRRPSASSWDPRRSGGRPSPPVRSGPSPSWRSRTPRASAGAA